MACAYCSISPHARLCPMAFIEGNPNRKRAFEMGIPVSTSDWIDAWASLHTHAAPNTWRSRLAQWLYPEAFTGFGQAERESLIESFSLHHRFVAEELARRMVDSEVRTYYTPHKGNKLTINE